MPRSNPALCAAIKSTPSKKEEMCGHNMPNVGLSTTSSHEIPWSQVNWNVERGGRISVEYCATILPFSHLTIPSAQALSLPESAVSKSIAVNVSKYIDAGGFFFVDFMSERETPISDVHF